MRTRSAPFLAVLTFLAALPLAAQESPAAYLVRVQGGVQVAHAGGATSAGAVGDALVPGDRILPAEGARAVLLTASGAQRVVTGPYTIPAPASTAEADLFARTVSALARASAQDARTAGGRVAAIRPIPGAPTVVAPQGRVVVTSTRPTFSWVGEREGSGFTVLVQRDEGTAMRFDASDALTVEETCRFFDRTDALVEKVCFRSTWTMPQDAPALTPGASYTWRVVPTAGRASGGGRFQVSGPEEYARLAEQLESISELGIDPEGDGLLLAIPAYRELGLLYDALAAITALEQSGAISPELHFLKGDILRDLGMEYEARQAFKKGETGR